MAQFAIFRVAKMNNVGSISASNDHCQRLRETPNADKSLQHLNEHSIGSDDLVEDIMNRVKEVTGEKGVRKNGVLCIENLLSASPEYFEGLGKKGKLERWKNATIEWLKDTYGEKNVVSVHMHLDEQTPHIHAHIVPVYVDKSGNEKLSAKHYVDGKKKLSELQDSYAEAVKDLGLERGIKGSQATHQEVKRFYGHIKDVNASIEEMYSYEKTIDLEVPESTFMESKAAFKEKVEILFKEAKEKVEDITYGSKMAQVSPFVSLERYRGLQRNIGSYASENAKYEEENRLLSSQNQKLESEMRQVRSEEAETYNLGFKQGKQLGFDQGREKKADQEERMLNLIEETEKLRMQLSLKNDELKKANGIIEQLTKTRNQFFKLIDDMVKSVAKCFKKEDDGYYYDEDKLTDEMRSYFIERPKLGESLKKQTDLFFEEQEKMEQKNSRGMKW